MATITGTLTVLCIEDDPMQAVLLKKTLEAINDENVLFEVCPDAAAATERACANVHDLIFLDYGLGEDNGLDVINSIREHGCEAPVIALTAHTDGYIAERLTRAGVDAYIAKRDLDTPQLAKAIREAAGNSEERGRIREMDNQVSRLESLAATLSESNAQILVQSKMDALTGVFSRASVLESLALEHSRSERTGRAFSVAMIDVDHFKKFNDSAGHVEGDKCLETIAGVLRSSCRGIDIIGRYGGEEFLVILPESDLAGAAVVAEKLVCAVRDAAIPHPGTGGLVSISVGVAEGACATPESVIADADTRLYDAKAAGRDGWSDGS